MRATVLERLQRAVLAHKTGNLQVAEGLYRDILSSTDNPSAIYVKKDLVALAHNNLGYLLQGQGKLEAAISSYRRAVNSKADYYEALNNLGLALRLAGRFEESVKCLRKVTINKPDYLQAHYNLGLSLQARGDLKDAIDSYKQIIRQQPDNADAYLAIGAAHYLDGDLDASIKAYNDALRIRPGYAEAYNNLSSAYLAKGDIDSAITNCEHAIKIDPRYGNAYNNLGHALVDRGDLDAALGAYESALELMPESPQPHNNLGNILKKLGRYEEALAHFNRINAPGSGPDARPGPAEDEFWVNNKSQTLECLYILGRHAEFDTRLKALADSGDLNRRVSAVAAFVCHQTGSPNPHQFCKNPLDYIHVGALGNYVPNVENYCTDLIKDAEKKSLVWEPKHGVTKAGYLSANTIFSAGKNTGTLEELIRKELEVYRDKYQGGDCEFINAWPADFSFKGWFVRLVRGGYQRPHIHPAGWLSGVIYLKTIEASNSDEGAIEFSLHGYDLPILNDDYPRIVHRPEVGEIVMFPSSLFHRTIPYEKETDRCVIAFDALPLVA